MRSPIVAMLWELWRVTRAEVAWKLALPIGAALVALGLGAAFGPAGDPTNTQGVKAIGTTPDEVAALALILIVLPHLPGWLSMAKLNGSQPGFPLYLTYTRPVRTAVIVGLPMAYLTVLSTAIYLVSAMVLATASGYAFPLLPVASWVAALTLVFTAAGWSTRNRTVSMLVAMFAVVRALGLAIDRLTAVELPGGYDWPPHLWPTLFDWPRTDYAWIALIGLACFSVTVVGVARQRHGAWTLTPTRWTGRSTALGSTPGSGLWGWLVSLFRVPCPTSSPMRAQLWLDLKSNGVPVLTIGLALAIVIVLVSAVSGPIDAAWNADPDVSCPIEECFWARAFPPMFAPFSLLVMLFLGGNAFGIRRRQGRASMSVFEATHAHGTAQLAVLKVVVKSVCVLAALLAIGVSVWFSMPLLGDAVFIQMWEVPLNSQRSAFSAAVGALTRYEQLALAVLAAGGVVLWVATWAALGALWTRYPRRLNIAASLLLLYGLAVGLLALAGERGIGPEIPLGVILRATSWVVAAAIVALTGYFVWRGFAERLLTVRQAWIVVFLSAAFAAASLTLLRAAGLSLEGMSAENAVRMLSLALLPLTVGVLAPWSYSHLRHG
jgi:hypothetical protein